MPDTYVYDGTWRGPLTDWHVYDNTAWRDLSDVWTYDNTAWRKVFEASSCATASIDSGQSAWFDTGCTDANECNICVGINHTNCTDVCHNIDTRLSINGGSFNLVFACSNDSCTNQTATQCNREYDCNLNAGGTKCYSDANTHKPRVEIQRDSDSVVEDTWTYSSTYSGVCVA